MLSINTNLSSLIAQSSLKDSTSILNQAVERMTTGYKINHASDNAANYSIATNMTTKINSYMVAEDNVLNGINMLDTANGILDEINDRVQRLHDLQIHASNATYGEESRKAINAEVNALVDEINRLYQTAEHNGIKLFMETEADASGNHYYEQESYADEETTFEQLEIGASSFGVYSQDGTLIQSYNTTDTDTLGDFLTILRNEGFNANINNGEITIKSTNDKYIAGALADELGISTKQTSYVAGTEQNFNNQIPVTTETTTIVTDFTTTTTSTTNTVTIPVTTTVETTTTRTEQTTTVTNTETLITDYTTTTSSTTQTSTIYTTATIETTTTTTTETIATVYTATTETLKVDTTLIETITPAQTATVYTVTTETLMVPATAATFAMRSGASPTAETSGFVQEVTRRDTTTMTALSTVNPNAILADGTYKISTTEELVQLAEMTNAGLTCTTLGEIVLANDIDLSSIENWKPIGDMFGSNNSFGLDFDGNGYVISNLTIDRPDGDCIGLFGSVVSIKNLGLENVNIKGKYKVGGLAGEGAYVSNCYVTGNIQGDEYIGGLVGQICSGWATISSCYVDGIVSGNSDVGGLIGFCPEFLEIEIVDITVSATVIGNKNSGGMVGYFEADDCGESISITNSQMISESNDINGVFVGKLSGDGEIKVTITDSTYNSIYDDLGIPLYVGTPKSNSSVTNVTPVVVTPSVTPPVTYTIATVETTLGELGVSDYNIYDYDGNLMFTFDAETALGTIIYEVNDYSLMNDLGINVNLIDGVFIINPEAPTAKRISTTLGLLAGLGAVETSSTITIPAVTQTTTVTTTATVDTKLSDILNDALMNLPTREMTIYYSDGDGCGFVDVNTLGDIIGEINNSGKGLLAEFNNGVITVISSGDITVDCSYNYGDNIFYELNTTQATSISTTTVSTTQTILVEQVTETPVTETIWTTTTAETTRTETITTTQTIDVTVTDTILVEQVVDTPVTETIYTTTTTETSRTETSYTTSTISLSGSTLYGALEPNSTLRVTVISDGTKTFVTLRSDTTFNDFYSDLSSFGITVSESGNTITFTGQGDSYIDSDNLEDLLGLSSVSKTTGQKTSNTDSEKLFAIEKNYGVYAPGQVTLQVGTNGDSSSQIEMDVSFKLRGINQLRGIGEDLDTDYLEIIDNILLELTAKQTEFGAVQNRLLSALDEVSIQYENLVSSRSTIRDADIAEVSSTYIQQQILQQAASTLLATANQSPSIALQLI